MDLFYKQIDFLIEKRLEAMRNGYKPNPDAGVDLLDLFLQTTTDKYTLGGMVFSFLSAGRKSETNRLWPVNNLVLIQVTQRHIIPHGL